ncbi:hypothetical protein ACVWZ6_008656 [Bradyrhizobium sp. GM6.1]
MTGSSGAAPLSPAPIRATSAPSKSLISEPSMHILLLGSGGREHALAWKIAASPLVT